MNEDGRNHETNVVKRLKKMIEANQYLAEIESLEALFPKLLALAKNVTFSEASSLMLYNPNRKTLNFVSVADEILGKTGGEHLKRSVELKMGEGIAGWVAENRKPLIVEDAHKDPRFSKQADKKTGFLTRNLMCVPLIYNKELLGVINVLNSKGKRHFAAEDQELLESFSHLAAVAIARSRLLETKLQQQKFQIQLEAASKIQTLFCPELPEMKAGSHAWAVSEPAIYVGGDLYDFIPLPDGSWVCYVADVSGKGLPAALFMVALWSRIRAEASLHNEVDKMLETVNDAMYELMADEGFFATIILGRYWPATGKIQLVRGGHLPPLLLSNNGLRDIPELKGLSLGAFSGVKYEKKEFSLLAGESIIFFTDGVTEAENDNAEMFGQNRLITFAHTVRQPPWGKHLLDTIISWQGFTEKNDDLTILEIWRDP